ncbi:MAG: hypothetical protein K0Q92_2523 [Steroidobacteraceae bacterium]|nr:hypothetical protein [Steroidobacteraceae bacterium]
MRTFAKVAVTLLLGAFAATANAHIEFVQARLFSLEGSDDRWVLEMEIHEWGSGRKLARPMRATVQFKREPQCIVNKELYLGTALNSRPAGDQGANRRRRPAQIRR